MRDRLIELLDGADLFLRNRASAKHTPLNEYDIEAMLDIAEICDEAARILEKAIVPPCKVGDKMYKLCSVNSSIKMGQMWDGKIVETNCDRCGYKNCSCYDIGLRERNNELFIDVIKETTINSLEFLVKIMPYVGTIWFTTKEEAEQALKGGGDNA